MTLTGDELADAVVAEREAPLLEELAQGEVRVGVVTGEADVAVGIRRLGDRGAAGEGAGALRDGDADAEAAGLEGDVHGLGRRAGEDPLRRLVVALGRREVQDAGAGGGS